MPEPDLDSASIPNSPDYGELVKFLVLPFLELPESLRVDCEVSPTKSKVWVRLAFEGSDKGRVFGRGGRNIQAIRTVLEAAAKVAGYSAYLDIFGSSASGREGGVEASRPEKPQARRPAGRSLPKPRSHHEE